MVPMMPRQPFPFWLLRLFYLFRFARYSANARTSTACFFPAAGGVFCYQIPNSSNFTKRLRITCTKEDGINEEYDCPIPERVWGFSFYSNPRKRW